MKRKILSIVLCIAVTLFTVSLTACDLFGSRVGETLTVTEFERYLSFNNYKNSTVTATCEEIKDGIDDDTHIHEYNVITHQFTDTAQYFNTQSTYTSSGTGYGDDRERSYAIYVWKENEQMYAAQNEDGTVWEGFDPETWWEEEGDWNTLKALMLQEVFMMFAEFDNTFFVKTEDGFALAQDCIDTYLQQYTDGEEFVVQTIELYATVENNTIRRAVFNIDWQRRGMHETMELVVEIKDVGTTVVEVPQEVKDLVA